jgi:hypothetical protein
VPDPLGKSVLLLLHLGLLQQEMAKRGTSWHKILSSVQHSGRDDRTTEEVVACLTCQESVIDLEARKPMSYDTCFG